MIFARLRKLEERVRELESAGNVYVPAAEEYRSGAYHRIHEIVQTLVYRLQIHYKTGTPSTLEIVEKPKQTGEQNV